MHTMDEMDERIEFQTLGNLLVQIASSELCQFNPKDERWIVAERKMMKMARCGGPTAMGPLLGLLRRPDLPEQVADVVAKAMALCCGPCAAPPAVRNFIFSPSLSVQVNEMDYVQGGLGWKVWGTALILSWRLLALKDMIHGKEVLELGSGCGLCGLLLAKLGAAKVVLTDSVSNILVNLCKNISLLTMDEQSKLKLDIEVTHDEFLCTEEKCMPSFEQSSEVIHSSDYIYQRGTPGESPSTCLVRVRKLDWMEDSGMAVCNSFIEIQAPVLFPKVEEDAKFDWVVGSDLLYDQQCLLSLADVIHRRLSAFGKALIVTPVRDKQLLDQFLKEVHRLGMSTKTEQIDQQEWNSCKSAMNALVGDNLLDEYGTMHDMDHYEGGILALFIVHEVQM